MKNVKHYGYENLIELLRSDKEILFFAYENKNVISAVLERKENRESLILGFVLCDKKYRGCGITKKLMSELYIRAKKMGLKYMTPGADEKAIGFYEKCRYKNDK